MIDQEQLARFIAHLSRHTFSAFIAELFQDENYYDAFRPLPEAGEDVFYQPFLDSYGESIHTIVLLHFPPLELFHSCDLRTIKDPTLIERLAKLRNMYHKRVGYWGMVSECLREDVALKSIKFVTNMFGIERKTYEEVLVPAYQRLKRYCGLKKPATFVGSCDSFVDLALERTQAALDTVLRSYNEGIAVSISEHDVSVQEYVGERSLASGLSAGTRSAYEPVMVRPLVRRIGLIHEFDQLLKRNAEERVLEEFLVAHYQEVFGAKYDRIETQLWLRFPALDLAAKERQLDLFLRNSLKNDWELFEVKRPVKLTTTYRDIPVIASELSNAIHQARNYARILGQDQVKRHFAAEGIEYYEPVLNLVIGRTPQIPHAQWRWLQTENAHLVRIFTFDDLLAEMRQRLQDHYIVLQGLLRTNA